MNLSSRKPPKKIQYYRTVRKAMQRTMAQSFKPRNNKTALKLKRRIRAVHYTSENWE